MAEMRNGVRKQKEHICLTYNALLPALRIHVSSEVRQHEIFFFIKKNKKKNKNHIQQQNQPISTNGQQQLKVET